MDNKTAIVTGGSSGIGLAICERLIERGMEVYSISRNPLRVPKMKCLHPVQLDLSDLDAVVSFLDSFVKEKGTPDLLVNNAGYTINKNFHEISVKCPQNFTTFSFWLFYFTG